MRLNRFQTRPKVASIDVAAYLRKLRLYKELPSINYLRQLHRNHLLTIPFENMDTHFRRDAQLDVESIYRKIIPTNRGGICYELNLLFYHLLIHLGYECQLISARVYDDKTQTWSHEYDHMAILVKIQESIFLCDVGFGDGFNYPKELKPGILQMDFNRYFQVFEDVNGNFTIKRTSDTRVFHSLYTFRMKNREPIEFIDRYNFHRTSPASHLVGRKIISKLTEEGRITLTDQKLLIAEMGEKIELPVLNDDDFFTKMEEHFDISHQTLLRQVR